jgi:hypothetical protein
MPTAIRGGYNANSNHTAYGVAATVTNSNATSGYNIAAYFSASGATSGNYGLLVAAGSVGIGLIAPTSTLHLQGSYATVSTATQTGSYVILATDNFVPFNISAAATATLPDATLSPGREIEIILISTGFTLTIATTSSQTVNGTIPAAITTQYKYAKYKSVAGNIGYYV